MGFLTALIYITLSFIVGPLLLGLSINLINIHSFSNYFETQILADFSLRLTFAAVGIILILFCLRYIQTIFLHSKNNKALIFESPEGKVQITLLAIEDMLKKMLEQRKEVSHIRPKVFLRKKRIEVVTRGILTTEVNLVEFTKEIQENVKKKMHTLLGEDKEVRVSLEIRKVALGDKKALIEDNEPEVPFRNY